MKDVLPVTLKSISHYNSVTGVSSDITELWLTNNCSTKAINSLSDLDMERDFCYFSNATYNASSMQDLFVCTNMIHSVAYHVNHSTSSTSNILAIEAEVVVTDLDIVIPPSPTTPFFSNALTQSFGIQYTSTDPADASTTNGNIVKRQRSGNPGYLMGKPILFGFQNSSNNAVNEFVEGLTLPISTGYGICPDASEALLKSATTFGYDSISGCRLLLTRQELKDFCCAGAGGSCLDNALNSVLFDSQYVNKANGIAYFLNFTPG